MTVWPGETGLKVGGGSRKLMMLSLYCNIVVAAIIWSPYAM